MSSIESLTVFHLANLQQVVQLQINNRLTVSCISKQGGTQSQTLLQKVTPNINWAEKNLFSLKASYKIPYFHKIKADAISRKFFNNTKLSLHQELFQFAEPEGCQK